MADGPPVVVFHLQSIDLFLYSELNHRSYIRLQSLFLQKPVVIKLQHILVWTSFFLTLYWEGISTNQQQYNRRGPQEVQINFESKFYSSIPYLRVGRAVWPWWCMSDLRFCQKMLKKLWCRANMYTVCSKCQLLFMRLDYQHCESYLLKMNATHRLMKKEKPGGSSVFRVRL